jgi:hypothetical protein
MSLQTVFSPFQARPGLSYHLSLAIGAMFASLLVVAYAAGASDEGAVRAHIVLQGAQMIALTVASGVIAGLVHLVSTAGGAALAAFSGSRSPVGA